MGSRAKKIILGIWGLLLFFSIDLGMSQILSIIVFPIYIRDFVSLLFAVGSITLSVHLYSIEKEEKVRDLLMKSKEIYSLDYSKLICIKSIELNQSNSYFVTLKSENDITLPLFINQVPKTQEELEELDKSFMFANNKTAN